MFKKLGECRNDMLSLFYGKLSELKTCEKLVKKHLPERIAQHCSITDTRNGSIIITANNSSILSLLRYEKSELLQKLRTKEKMYALRSIDIKLAISEQLPPQRKLSNKTTSLSSKSYESIHATATQCTYSPLKRALEKLEQTLKEKIS